MENSVVIRPIDWQADLPALDPLLDDRDRQRMPALMQCSLDGDAEVLVAEVSGQGIVGRITSHYHYRSEMGWLPDADTEHFQSQGNAYIETLMVEASLRSKGIGKQLLDAAIACGISRGIKVFGLHTDEGNHGARRFYERDGWQLQSIAHPEWSGGSPMCVYALGVQMHADIEPETQAFES